MATKKSARSVNVNNITFWVSILILIVMCVGYFAEWGEVIFQYRIYTFSSLGFLGIASAFLFGFHSSKNGHPEKPVSSHLLFSVFFSIYTVIAYYIGFSFYNMLKYLFF